MTINSRKIVEKISLKLLTANHRQCIIHSDTINRPEGPQRRDHTMNDITTAADEARRRRLSNSTSVLEMMRIKGAGLENASIDEIRAKLYPAIYGKDS